MAPDPNWPAMLCLHNALFDIIQCREATKGYFNVDDPEYETLFEEWRQCLVRMGIENEAPEQ